MLINVVASGGYLHIYISNYEDIYFLNEASSSAWFYNCLVCLPFTGVAGSYSVAARDHFMSTYYGNQEVATVRQCGASLIILDEVIPRSYNLWLYHTTFIYLLCAAPSHFIANMNIILFMRIFCGGNIIRPEYRFTHTGPGRCCWLEITKRCYQ